jgi:hypothetical protein
MALISDHDRTDCKNLVSSAAQMIHLCDAFSAACTAAAQEQDSKSKSSLTSRERIIFFPDIQNASLESNLITLKMQSVHGSRAT